MQQHSSSSRGSAPDAWRVVALIGWLAAAPLVRSAEPAPSARDLEFFEAKVKVLSADEPLLVNPDHPAIQVAAEVFGRQLGKPTVFTRSGGSIPIVGDFARCLGIPTILMGFGLPDDGLHSPNEKYKIENYYLGILTIADFFAQYGHRG